jgi:hypothetical protein
MRATRANRFETVCLHIRCLVEGEGFEPTWTLTHAYRSLLRKFDAGFEVHPATEKAGRWIPEEEDAWKAHGEVFLTARGPRFGEFFRPEEGVHLFFLPFGGALPVRVGVTTIPKGTDPAAYVRERRALRARWVDALEGGEPPPGGEDPFRPGPVVRLYSLPSGEEKGTVTDLRTGVLDRIEPQGHESGREAGSISANALFAWLFSALPEEDRPDFDPGKPVDIE